MPVLTVEHETTYSYRRAVGFGEHRMMFRPRDSVDQKLLDWQLEIGPAPAELRSILDTQGNNITLARFRGRAKELRFLNRLVVDHTPVVPEPEMLAPYARSWPFTYELDDRHDLARTMDRHYPDPGHAVDAWARSFLLRAQATSIAGTVPVLDLLRSVTAEIRRDFTYTPRFEEGMQEPARTLALRNGTCRDFAILMMEAVRSLGFAARFVTGYIYSPGADPARPAPPGGAPTHSDTARAVAPAGVATRLGGGSTHAWIEVFLPGLGWTDFDPTNDIVGSRDLIRVASVRDWHQAVPLAGTWTGFPADSVGMSVSVSVSSSDAAPILPQAPRVAELVSLAAGGGTRAMPDRSAIGGSS
ncbi:transglutaminase family protein [Rhizosaccharibacter radicis]|uniref:Transglutaminase family protein n=1 Tax=Rhizosaccharibacter radicis TaxID=2782605 RepID=A0ABT1W0V4_9PROT|nr:transglutaminase family protein [Acetobacteraceae bacterium KSS12]